MFSAGALVARHPVQRMTRSPSPPRKLRSWVGDDDVLADAILSCSFKPIIGQKGFKDGELFPFAHVKATRHTTSCCLQAIAASPKVLQLSYNLYKAGSAGCPNVAVQ